MNQARLRVGVIGCGVIAQVIHLPNLAASDQFTIAALCDASPVVLSACAERFGVARTCPTWEAMLDERLDAVFVLTPGSHTPMVCEFAARGVAVFVEKPLCFSTDEGAEIQQAMSKTGVPVMVGYMKRYSPSFEHLRDRIPELGDVRFAQATTLEAPFEPYIMDRRVSSSPPPMDVQLAFGQDADERLVSALGADTGPELRDVYRTVLLDCLVHEINLLRGLLGEVREVDHAYTSRERVTALIRFESTRAAINWVDLPGVTRYSQRFELFGEGARAALTFGSPYLPGVPPDLTWESGRPDSIESSSARLLVSYDDPFREEIASFYRAVREGGPIRTTVDDAIADVAVCQSLIKAHQSVKEYA